MKPSYRFLSTMLLSLIATSSFAEEWVYKQSTDEMRGTVSKTARISSENKVSPGSYYSSDTELILHVRKNQHGFGIAISAYPKGQLWCSYSNCSVAVKFDDEKPINWSMSRAEAGHSDTLFFNNEPRMLAKLKSSKKAIVEVTFYDRGTYQFNFKTAGLVWEDSEKKKKS